MIYVIALSQTTLAGIFNALCILFLAIVTIKLK